MALFAAFMLTVLAAAILVSILNKDAQDRKIEGLTRRLKDLETESLPNNAIIFRKRG